MGNHLLPFLCCLVFVPQLTKACSPFTTSFVRYGKREGFSNLPKKKVHDAATKFQRVTDLSIHENVLDYEEDWSCLFSF